MNGFTKVMKLLIGRRSAFSMARMGRRFFFTRSGFLLGLVFFCGLLIFQPFRSIVLGPFIPTTWSDTDTVHLYHVLTKFQDINVNDVPKKTESNWASVQVNLSKFADYESRAKREYPEFWSRLKELQTDPNADPRKLQEISIFQPSLNATEKAQIMFAFDTFHHACMVGGLLYFIMEASLMGVLRHHGPIPWDDDIDVVMNVRQWQRIRNVLGNIDGFTLFTPSSSQWKFYMNSARSFPEKPFKFPFIDIFFFDQDETHVWALTKGLKHDLVYEKKDVFPLQERPYDGKLVPVPCNLDLIVTKAHDINKCVTPEYNHKINDFENIRVVDCKVLYDVYPFVFADKPISSDNVMEHLRIGDVEIHTINVTTTCSFRTR